MKENGSHNTYLAERFTTCIHVYSARHLGVTLDFSSHTPLASVCLLFSTFSHCLLEASDFSHDHCREVPFSQRIQFRLLPGLHGCLKPSPAHLTRFSYTSLFPLELSSFLVGETSASASSICPLFSAR